MEVSYSRRFYYGDDAIEVFVSAGHRVSTSPATSSTAANSSDRETIINGHVHEILYDQRQAQKISERYAEIVATRRRKKQLLTEFWKNGVEEGRAKLEVACKCSKPDCKAKNLRIPTFQDANEQKKFEEMQDEDPALEKSEMEAVREATELSGQKNRAVQALRGMNLDPEQVLAGAQQLVPAAPGAPASLTRETSDSVWRLPVAAALTRDISVEHSQFNNESNTSCWLSCVFQSLWHCNVFRFAFDRYLKSDRAAEQDRPTSASLLKAFQLTWERYPEAQKTGKTVSPTPMMDAMGIRGFDDPATGLGLIRNAFEESKNPTAMCIGKNMATQIIVALEKNLQTGPDLTGPPKAWTICEEEKVTECPLIAVVIEPPTSAKLNSERLNSEVKKELIKMYVPQNPNLDVFPDLGRNHRLVAMVLFYETMPHYIVLCRSHRDPSKCRVFNDMKDHREAPILSHFPEELPWTMVDETCQDFGLFPRLILYESEDAARKVWRTACRDGGCSQM